jgi:NADH:ubiquinone oxidoreductase subunit 6 (subunit J)
MDSLHTIGFYVSAGLSVAGALLVALLPGRGPRGAALGLTGVGLAGIYLFLSAGFAAIVALVCYAGCALLLAGPRYRSIEYSIGPLWRQVGALAAAGLVGLVAYSSFRGDFVHATQFYGGWFGSAAVGRLLFAHDAYATEAVAALIVIALVGGVTLWQMRERSR